ncbi:MAG: glycine betaine ABC transporter substrate-binding protein [Candidatus Eisenbacteria bacterium]
MGTLFRPGASRAEADLVVVGSKKFTESVVLGEIAVRVLSESGIRAEHRRELGGTRILWGALLAGDIQVYPEYTGTLEQEILADENVRGEEALRSALRTRGIGMSRPLGFNNTYAIGMRKDRAGSLGIHTISDLVAHPELKFGFGNEFMDRGDGWPALARVYGLPQQDVRGLDHDLGYRGLESGAIDAIDLYSTDAEIRHYDLAVLADDRGHFPRYDAVWLYRLDAPASVAAALAETEGAIDEGAMVALNSRVKLDRVPESQVAADFLADLRGTDGSGGTVAAPGFWARLWARTYEHLGLVLVSLLGAIIVAVPLGVLAALRPRFGQLVLGVVGVVQTVPSLALLVFMIPWLGIGAKPAVAALFLYSLLPIVRNTHSGLHDIPAQIRESAQALGLPGRVSLFQVELPMASRSILAGIKTSAVINIGTATLGALIGAGGYGQPILTGIRLDDMALILEGAVPAALLALFAQAAFEMLDRLVVPRGLRLRPER